MEPYERNNTGGRKRYFSSEENVTPDQSRERYNTDEINSFDQFSNIDDNEHYNNDDIEFSTEFLADDDDELEKDDDSDDFMMQSLGWLAIVLSVLAFFTMPILFAAAGIILGFISRNRGYVWVGNSAIGLGIIALIIQMLIFPLL